MRTGVSVREAKEEDALWIARVHVESWRTTYAGIVPRDYLDGLSVGDRERRWREILAGGSSGWNCVAESSESEIVGFSSVGPERAPGNPGWELYAIYLLRNWQGAGLGRRLFSAALEASGADDAGAPVSTWCISENPSCRFYEALGGEVLETQMAEFGGVKLEETCYGWRDAQELRSRLIAEC